MDIEREETKEFVIYAIDLGNDFFSVSYFDGKNSQVIESKYNKRKTEPYITVVENIFLVADEAISSLTRKKAESTILSAKRHYEILYKMQIVKPYDTFLPYIVNHECAGLEIKFPDQNKHIFSSDDYYKTILKECKKIILKTDDSCSPQTKLDIILTVPNNFNDEHYKAIQNSATDLGIKIHCTIKDTNAAAVDYLYDQYLKNDMIFQEPFVVFKMGATSTEILLAEVKEREFNSLKIESNMLLGGEDVTNFLMDICIQNVKAKFDYDISNNKFHCINLRRECEKGKRLLQESSSYKFTIDVPIPELESEYYFVEITQEELNNFIFNQFWPNIHSLFTQIILEIKKNKFSIDKVVLLGGSSRLVSVHDCIIKLFLTELKTNVNLIRTINQDEASVNGAALLGYIKRISDLDIKESLPFNLRTKDENKLGEKLLINLEVGKSPISNKTNNLEDTNNQDNGGKPYAKEHSKENNPKELEKAKIENEHISSNSQGNKNKEESKDKDNKNFDAPDKPGNNQE